MKKLSYENADKVMELYKKPLPDKEMKKKIAQLFEDSYQEGRKEGKLEGVKKKTSRATSTVKKEAPKVSQSYTYKSY